MTLVAPEVILSADDLARLGQAVYAHCGIRLTEEKRRLVESRLAKLVRRSGFSSASEYLKEALDQPKSQTFAALIDAMSTNLTSFFREPDHFEFLSKEFLPTQIRRSQADGTKRIRGWSAGCSSGEEAYTLAMVLNENVPDIQRWDVKLLATDICSKVLASARRGTYDADRTKSIPAELRAKYFAVNRSEGLVFFDAMPALRNLIAFRPLNLMEPWPFNGPFDFIFCRNVMIYFDKPTQQRLVNRYFDILSPGGVLFTGHSESLTGVRHPFEYVRPTIYQKPL